MYDHTITIIALALIVVALTVYCERLLKQRTRLYTTIASIVIDNVDLKIENFELERKVHNMSETLELLMVLASNNFTASLVPLLTDTPATPEQEWQAHVDEALAVGNE